ncbi:MAG: methyltransferase domain-containing protein [Candidatus Sungbacteria bacterium]|nr:methyltransferase domain-containing protein [Candidatus Sungbacteria bacterium]
MSHPDYSFAIKKFRELHNWKILRITKDVSLVEILDCPSKCGDFRTLAVLTGNHGARFLRVGCCGACGYVGYKDKPTKEWITKFYASTWDGSKKDVKGQERYVAELMAEKRKKYMSDSKEFVRVRMVIERFAPYLDKEKPICDIGSGFGLQLDHFKRLGFKQVFGMEASPHRAEVARRAFGLQVQNGVFEGEEVQNSLGAHGPFGLIYSNNVIEHTYAPEEILALSAALQREGDYFIASLPRFRGDPSLSTLLFFPHLNSFTQFAFQKLLLAHGYKMKDELSTSHEICVLAQKTEPAMLSSGRDFFAEALAKYERFFKFNRFKKTSVFWCARDTDVSGTLPYFGDNKFTRVGELVWAKMLRRQFAGDPPLVNGIPDLPIAGGMISFVVGPVEKRFTDAQSSPIEIQFEDDIMLTYR